MGGDGAGEVWRCSGDGIAAEDLAGFEKNWTATRRRHAAMTLDEEPRIHEPVPLMLVCCGVDETDGRNAMRHRH